MLREHVVTLDDFCVLRVMSDYSNIWLSFSCHVLLVMMSLSWTCDFAPLMRKPVWLHHTRPRPNFEREDSQCDSILQDKSLDVFQMFHMITFGALWGGGVLRWSISAWPHCDRRHLASGAQKLMRKFRIGLFFVLAAVHCARCFQKGPTNRCVVFPNVSGLNIDVFVSKCIWFKHRFGCFQMRQVQTQIFAFTMIFEPRTR
jgi:hypothetical protein